MRADHYARSGRRWALGAELVYGPIAAELVAMTPFPGGLHVAMRALAPPEQGHDFRVVRVCTQSEYDQAQRAGEGPSEIPWPYSAVLRVLDESNLVMR